MTQTRKIRWLLSHEPVELFIRTAKAFANRINEISAGAMEIDVYTVAEYSDKFKNGLQIDPMTLIHDGDIEMSQLQISIFGEQNATDFFALELPFLFRDHDHATRVLEGEIGQSMLSSLQDLTPATGLAFTYSGGFRCVAADKTITTAEDLQGLNMTTNMNPIMIDTAEAFGCIPVSVPVKDYSREAIDLRSSINAVETTLPRYVSEANPAVHKYVTNTKHSMYLTTIIVGNKFWNSLTSEEQAMMRDAALYSSRLERQWSVDDADTITNSDAKQQELGIQGYAEFNSAETAKLKQSVEKIYSKYKTFFTPGLVDGIIRS
jgi:TRAP-type C4-dicarboxylate transport system substrate-binding protein